MRRGLVDLILALTLSVLLTISFIYGQIIDAVEVPFTDAEQGGSIWLRSSDGTDAPIEGGPRPAGPTAVAHLQDAGINEIGVVVFPAGMLTTWQRGRPGAGIVS